MYIRCSPLKSRGTALSPVIRRHPSPGGADRCAQAMNFSPEGLFFLISFWAPHSPPPHVHKTVLTPLPIVISPLEQWGPTMSVTWTEPEMFTGKIKQFCMWNQWQHQNRLTTVVRERFYLLTCDLQDPWIHPSMKYEMGKLSVKTQNSKQFQDISNFLKALWVSLQTFEWYLGIINWLKPEDFPNHLSVRWNLNHSNESSECILMVLFVEVKEIFAVVISFTSILYPQFTHAMYDLYHVHLTLVLSVLLMKRVNFLTNEK